MMGDEEKGLEFPIIVFHAYLGLLIIKTIMPTKPNRFLYSEPKVNLASISLFSSVSCRVKTRVNRTKIASFIMEILNEEPNQGLYNSSLIKQQFILGATNIDIRIYRYF
jgi:hypothetical protein